MKYIEREKYTVSFSRNMSDWALPVRIGFEKKLVSIQFLCFLIEVDWISEADVVIEEEE